MLWFAILLFVSYIMFAVVLMRSKTDMIRKFGGRKSVYGLIAMFSECVIMTSVLVSSIHELLQSGIFQNLLDWFLTIFLATLVITVGGNIAEHVTEVLKNNNNGGKK